jgi:hypothetical protein
MAASWHLVRRQVAVAAEAGSPPPARCGDAMVPRDCQRGRKGFKAGNDGSAGAPNPGTSWEVSSEMKEAKRDRKAHGE